MGTPFYHELTRKTITAFGSLFGGIAVQRYDAAGVLTQTIPVPIAFSQKDKMLQRVDADPANTTQTKIVLPRIGFEIVSYKYDETRNLGKTKQIICNDPANGTRKIVYTGAPYNIALKAYVATKTFEDGIQIVEQIVPYFKPSFVLTFKLLPTMNLSHEVPVVLNGVTLDYQYDGSYEKVPIVIHELDFTMKTTMYGPISTQGIILVSRANLPGFATYTATGTVPTQPITESWVETL